MGRIDEERMEKKRKQTVGEMLDYELAEEEFSDSCYEDAVRELCVEYTGL